MEGRGRRIRLLSGVMECLYSRDSRVFTDGLVDEGGEWIGCGGDCGAERGRLKCGVKIFWFDAGLILTESNR